MKIEPVCPFCKCILQSYGKYAFEFCHNHNVFVFVDHFNAVYLCKNEYEIEINHEKQKTVFRKHMPVPHRDLDNPFYVNGFYYMFAADNILSIDIIYNVTPNNFDSYVEKFKSLTIFL